MNDNNKFEYTYRALNENEKRTIESIKSQYDVKASAPASAYDQIVRLDKKIKRTANAVSIIVGILGALIFGLGLAMVLEWQIYFWGVLVSLIGSVPVGLAYLAYYLSLRLGRKKHRERILALSKEALREEEN